MGFSTVDLGAIASGGNVYRNLDRFGQRAKPSTELEETITVRLRAYTDVGYSNLMWTYEKALTVKFIDSNAPSYTIDYENNFDDGTVQGWAGAVDIGGGTAEVAVVTDYVLSPPYSLRLYHWCASSNTDNKQMEAHLYKSFNTPNKDEVYAIIGIRHVKMLFDWCKHWRVLDGTTLLIYVGRPNDNQQADYFPTARWMRCVVPLPPNTTVEVRIYLNWRAIKTASGAPYYLRSSIRLDDFKIISK